MTNDESRHQADSGNEFGNDMVEPKPVAAEKTGPFALRTILYGGLVVAGGALMAVSARPELAGYMSFASEKSAATCPTSAGGSCCASGAEKVAVAADKGSCCATVSRFGAMCHAAATDDTLADAPPAPPLPEQL